MAKLVVGCGYLGHRVARRWLAAGEEVFVTTRSAGRAERLAAAGFRPILADVTRSVTLSGLPPADAVLYSVGYDPSGGESRHKAIVDGLRNVLEALGPEAGRVIYVSSTGVYGPAEGWVTEGSPCEPTRPAARALREAEQALEGHFLGPRAIILRLAGLYGPGRVPRMADLRAGRPIAVASGGWINLIHVDDAVEAVLAATVRGKPPRTYNVSDGSPALRQDFYAYLAELLGVAAPRFVEPCSDYPGEGRGGGRKKVNNARLLAELKIALNHPSYRNGLAAIVAGAVGGSLDG